MSISKRKGSNKKTGLCKPAISGDMTIYAAEIVKNELNDLIDDYKRFEFDLSEVEEIDTSGVQILLSFANHVRARGDDFEIKASNDEVDKVLGKYHLSNDQLTDTVQDG